MSQLHQRRLIFDFLQPVRYTSQLIVHAYSLPRIAMPPPPPTQSFLFVPPCASVTNPSLFSSRPFPPTSLVKKKTPEKKGAPSRVQAAPGVGGPCHPGRGTGAHEDHVQPTSQDHQQDSSRGQQAIDRSVPRGVHVCLVRHESRYRENYSPFLNQLLPKVTTWYDTYCDGEGFPGDHGI